MSYFKIWRMSINMIAERTYMFYEWIVNGQHDIAVYLIDCFKTWVGSKCMSQMIFWKKEAGMWSTKAWYITGASTGRLPPLSPVRCHCTEDGHCRIRHWFPRPALFHLETLFLSRAKLYGTVASLFSSNYCTLGSSRNGTLDKKRPITLLMWITYYLCLLTSMA